MPSSQIFRVGIIGTIVTAVCCFTPVLPFILSAIGISRFVGYLDMVLMPLLAIFAGIAIFGFLKRRSA